MGKQNKFSAKLKQPEGNVISATPSILGSDPEGLNIGSITIDGEEVTNPEGSDIPAQTDVEITPNDINVSTEDNNVPRGTNWNPEPPSAKQYEEGMKAILDEFFLKSDKSQKEFITGFDEGFQNELLVRIEDEKNKRYSGIPQETSETVEQPKIVSEFKLKANYRPLQECAQKLEKCIKVEQSLNENFDEMDIKVSLDFKEMQEQFRDEWIDEFQNIVNCWLLQSTDLNHMGLEKMSVRLPKLARIAEKLGKYALAGELHNLHASAGIALNRLKALSKEAMEFNPPL